MAQLKTFLDIRVKPVARLYRRLRDVYYYHTRRVYPTQFGFVLTGDADLDISRDQEGEIQIFEQAIEQADVLIDVGANVGLFSLLAWKHGCYVVSVEPHQGNVALLSRNIRLNEAHDIEVHALALGEKQGNVWLYGGRQGASLSSEWGGISANYRQVVPMITLDQFLFERFSGKRLVIKIDAEGHEYPILKGALLTLDRLPRVCWIVEHGFTENFGGGLNPNFLPLFELFFEHGYQAFTLTGQPVVLADAQRWIQQGRRDFGTLYYVFKIIAQ